MASSINDLGAQTHVPTKPTDRVGVRGCIELIIKLLILIVLLALLLLYWLFQQEPDPRVIAALIALILLVAALIYRQGHFVRLNCGLTAPSGCVHGDPSILTDHILEPIKGTASGSGFSHYKLFVVYQGGDLADGVIYANSSGNPDQTATQGNHQVSGGTLGFVNIHKIVEGAGADLLTDTAFTIRLEVVGADGSKKICTVNFELSASSSFIKKVGAAWSHRYYLDEEPLQIPAPPTTAVSPAPSTVSTPTPVTNNASVGGGIYVRGSADSFGCTGEKIAAVRVWEIPGHGYAKPPNGTPTASLPAMPAGSQKISEVLYLTDDQRQHNSLRGASSEGNILTYHDNWFTRWEAEYTDAGLINIYIVPDIREKTWSTPATGKFTLLLQVEDTPGNTYYDVQRVWVDNESPIAKISSIGGLTACKDLKLSNFVGTTAKIRGFAWDHPIEGVSPNPPNNNFREYSMGFKKNGGGSGSITAAPVTTAVPSDWPGPPAADGVLADWDVVAAIDGGAGPVPANSPKLARGDRCAYVITLSVTDRTLVGEGGNNHHSTDLYAINVINDIT